MPTPNIIQGDVIITGSIEVQGTATINVPRSSIRADSLQAYEIPLQMLRVHDAFQTTLPSVGASDDIGLTAGTYGTQIPYLKSQDLNALGAMTTEYARTKFTLPPEYVTGSQAYLRVCAGMLTSVAATSATVDLEAFLCGRATVGPLVSGSDLVTTAATTCNSTTLANVDFTLTSGALIPGSVLDIRLAFNATSATASSHFLIATHLEAILQVKG